MFSEKYQKMIQNFVLHILFIVKFDWIFFKMIIFFFYIFLWMTITLAINKNSKNRYRNYVKQNLMELSKAIYILKFDTTIYLTYKFENDFSFQKTYFIIIWFMKQCIGDKKCKILFLLSSL